MCGIFGAVGSTQAAAITLNKLKELEYRGYDSWGIATLEGEASSKQKPHLTTQKQTSPIQLQPDQLLNQDSTLALGHTRWATHGGVTLENAHPHLNQDQTLAVVHNGIIENYQQLKSQLADNYQFASETDTEIFVHLVDRLLEDFCFLEAVRLAFQQVQGYNAFVIADSKTKQLTAIKQGSPLIIGLPEEPGNPSYLASDVNVLLEYTRRVVFLQDNQMTLLSDQAVKFINALTGHELEPKIETVNWQPEKSTQNKFKFMMENEIHDQPGVLTRIQLEFAQQVETLSRLIERFPQIYLVGCGSAYHAALTSSYLLAKQAGIKSQAVVGSEFSYQEQFCDPKNTLVIFFSQSGETIDVIKPLRAMKQKGVTTVGLVNSFGSTLYRLADHKIWLKAGPEKSVLSTKAFTAKLAIMSLVATNLAQRSAQTQIEARTQIETEIEARTQNKTRIQIETEIETTTKKTSERLAKQRQQLGLVIQDIKRILQPQFQHQYLQPVVDYLTTQPNIFGIGRGLSYPIILEAALKIKEVSYHHMEGFAGGELKHGVIALIEPGVPCLVVAPTDHEQQLTLSGAMEIKARGGKIIGLADQNHQVFDYFVPVPSRGVLSALTNSVVGQLIAYLMARALELDPDKPRNLAKSVTVV
ncbi:MAG: isomerizing glutamine--fructose-6-phosphate transaminase [Candidatus Pacebacteria bacterium]|nr:isomerizing glutamine--fructose-6-phosphate transaminase [Candidatus Paceibacterota bacterium]